MTRQQTKLHRIISHLAITLTVLFFASGGLTFGAPAGAQTVEALPSWNDRKAKRSIIDFVTQVTRPGSPDFVPPAERIAVFDNDGTLWAERPMYFQVLFALDRVKALAPEHPEWKDTEPFASLLKGDVEGAMADGMKSSGAIPPTPTQRFLLWTSTEIVGISPQPGGSSRPSSSIARWTRG